MYNYITFINKQDFGELDKIIKIIISIKITLLLVKLYIPFKSYLIKKLHNLFLSIPSKLIFSGKL